MGKRGRKPLPTETKRRRGNPGCRPLNDAEPEPPCGVPQAPVYLCELGRSCWERLVPMLRSMGVLTVADADALGQLCQSLAVFHRVVQSINRVETGAQYATDDTRKLLITMKEAQTACARGFAMFGLTPADRASLRVGKDAKSAKDDPIENFRFHAAHGG